MTTDTLTLASERASAASFQVTSVDLLSIWDHADDEGKDKLLTWLCAFEDRDDALSHEATATHKQLRFLASLTGTKVDYWRYVSEIDVPQASELIDSLIGEGEGQYQETTYRLTVKAREKLDRKNRKAGKDSIPW